MAQKYYLAVDGGGTKTTVWCSTEDQKIVGKGKSGAMSLAAVDEVTAVKHLLEAVEQATNALDAQHIESIVIGLAGVDTAQEKEQASATFSKALQQWFTFDLFLLVNDIEIALESASQAENAIALISGTGSNCFGRNEQGETAKVGGMDYLLSDQGSGFDIGQHVLRRAVKSYDGRSQKSIIEKLTCEYFGIDSIATLKDKVYHPPLNKTDIAKLSQICFDAYAQGDMAANEILNRVFEELSLMVRTILRRLDLENKPTDLVLVGGIATDPAVASQLEARLRTRYSRLRCVIPDHPPVMGALRLAMKKK